MGRKWTPEQREVKAQAVRAYWQTHRHPSLGKAHSEDTVSKMRKPKDRPPILGHCIICGRALYSRESLKRGMGPECAGLAPVH